MAPAAERERASGQNKQSSPPPGNVQNRGVASPQLRLPLERERWRVRGVTRACYARFPVPNSC